MSVLTTSDHRQAYPSLSSLMLRPKNLGRNGAHLAMDDPPAFERQGVFPLMELPLELRRRIYQFAVAEPHPLPLISHGDSLDNNVTWTVEKDLRMLETCREFYTQMEDFLYAENSFFIISNDALRCKGEAMNFRIDPRRIQKCYISIVDMAGWSRDGDDPGFRSYSEILCFHDFITALILPGHRLKYLLVEFEPGVSKPGSFEPAVCAYLMQASSPLSMLRRIGLVHFRSQDDRMFPCLRLWEALMMGDQPQPFSDMVAFANNLTDFDDRLLAHPEELWYVQGLDVRGKAVVQSEEQMDIVARRLHSVLGIEGDFIPQSELGRGERSSISSEGPDGCDEMFMQNSAGAIVSYD